MNTAFPRRGFHFAALTVLSLLFTGCLSRPTLVPQTFSFSSPAVGAKAAPANAPVLSLRRVSVAAPFDNQSFVYRTGEFSYERDPYAGFLVPPEESLAEPIRNYLRASGAFHEVTEPGSFIQPNTIAEVTVGQLYGDFRNREHPAAVLEMHFSFLEASHGAPGKVLLEKSFSERVPLQARTAAALMAGWNAGLEKILRGVIADLKQETN